jgi:hypothetical protein
MVVVHAVLSVLLLTAAVAETPKSRDAKQAAIEQLFAGKYARVWGDLDWRPLSRSEAGFTTARSVRSVFRFETEDGVKPGVMFEVCTEDGRAMLVGPAHVLRDPEDAQRTVLSVLELVKIQQTNLSVRHPENVGDDADLVVIETIALGHCYAPQDFAFATRAEAEAYRSTPNSDTFVGYSVFGTGGPTFAVHENVTLAPHIFKMTMWSDLDAFAGMSGTPVFRVRNGGVPQLAGFVVRLSMSPSCTRAYPIRCGTFIQLVSREDLDGPRVTTGELLNQSPAYGE